MSRNGNNQGNFGNKSLQSLTDLPLHSHHENPDTQGSARGDPSRALSIQDDPATGNNTSNYDQSFSPTETRETIPTSEDFANTGTARYFNPREDCSRTQQLHIFDTHECLSCTYGASAFSDFHTDTEHAAIRSCSVPDPSTEAAAQASDRSQALPIRRAGGNDLPVVNPISDNASGGYVQMEQRSADAFRGVDITQGHAISGNSSPQDDGSFQTQLKCGASDEGASARSSMHETSAKEIEQGATAAVDTNASYENSDFDLLLIGKTGNGKSATGNSIAGKKVFESKPSTSSVTTNVSCARVQLQEGTINLVDTPGLWDTRISEDQIKEDIKYSIAINPRGYHAFLLVLQYANRLTEEEIKTISILREIFEDSFLKDRGILVLSHGDQFARDNDNQEHQKPIEEYCSEQTGPFYDLYLECGKRVVIFDNVTKDTDVKKNQVKKLIELVKSLGSKHRFKDENFMMAERVHNTVESVREQIQVYFEVLDDVKPFNNADEAVNILLQFSGRTDDLLKEIHTADNETHALDDYYKIIDALNNLILEKLEISFRMQDDKVNQKGLQAVFDSWQSQYGKQRSAYEEFRDRGRSFLDVLVKAVSWTFERF